MRRVHNFIRNSILQVVDFFYPPFKKIFPIQTFRYAACGGFNTVFAIVLYFIGYNYVFTQETVTLNYQIALSRHIAADYLFAFWIAFPVGFYLSRYVVFQESNLPRRVQLFRYFVVVMGSVVLNYLCLKFFVEFCFVPGPLAKIFTAVVVIIYSYFSQINFSFKTKAE